MTPCDRRPLRSSRPECAGLLCEYEDHASEVELFESRKHWHATNLSALLFKATQESIRIGAHSNTTISDKVK